MNRLRELWVDEKRSASQIAAEFDVSRNAVIGKVHRMGLGSHTTVKPKPKPPAPRKMPGRKPADPLPPEEPETPEPPPQFLAERIETIRRDQCHYPHGDGPFEFCGQPVERGASFCSYHHRVCYHAATPARRAHNDLGTWRGVR